MNLNTKTKAKIHNKFHIEVKDANSGKVKQEGFAENIVLDGMYTQLSNFDSQIFRSIQVGSGLGTPSPSRNALFNRIGGAIASVEETIRSFPVSSVTKSITFGTSSTLNGQNITEVGIGQSNHTTNNSTSNRVLTHAMIKDAEGNPLSVHKDELNIITIYATLYLELVDDPNAIGVLSRDTNNPLISYVISNNTIEQVFRFSTSDYGDPLNRLSVLSDSIIHPQKTSNVGDRKTIFNARVDVDRANMEIMEVALGSNVIYHTAFKFKIDGSEVWQPLRISNANIGVGDGESTEFTLPHHRMLDVDVKVDGLSVNNYSILNNDRYGGSFPLHAMAADGSEVLERWRDVSILRQHIPSDYGSLLVDTDKIAGKILSVSPTDSNQYLLVRNSNGQSVTLRHGDVVPDDIVSAYHVSGRYNNESAVIYVSDPLPTLTLQTPPAEGEIVTVDYTVPYIPKTEDYVLDLHMEIQWV